MTQTSTALAPTSSPAPAEELEVVSPPQGAASIVAAALKLCDFATAIKTSIRTGVSGVRRISTVTAGPLFGNLTIGHLAWLHEHPECEEMRMAVGKCRHCHTGIVRGAAIWLPILACDACAEEWDQRYKIEKMKGYWFSLCPPKYHDTDARKQGFPAAEYTQIGKWNGARKEGGLLLIGPPNSGKTRVAFMLLKRALLDGRSVAVMYPEDLADAKGAREPKQAIQAYGQPDVLLMREPFLSGAADERTMSFLRNLIDYRARHNKVVIVTTQIGAKDYASHVNRFGNASAADAQRCRGIISQLSDSCREVQFGAGPVGAAQPSQRTF